jgi:muramoyltetrapeptide carboxypeptidase
MHLIRPPRIVPGARVAIVAPAGPVPREPFAAGAAILGARYELVHDERIFDRSGFLAGDDAARAAELQRALTDPTIAAVICARGGWGILRILDRLDAAAFARAPKPIVGFSDVTALLVWAALAGVASLHAPVVTQLGKLPADDAAALFALLESPAAPPPLTDLQALAPGRGEGRLWGGNLEVLSRLCGTPWSLPADEPIVLLIEEVGERPYRIDRQLTQLRLSGALRSLAGVIVGDLVGCVEKDGGPPDALAVIVERLGAPGVPILAGAPVGHGARNRALPHGARVRVDGAAGRVEFLESAVT